MRREEAETIALQALGWIAGQDEIFQSFLGVTGASAGDVARAAGQPAFLGAVLDFLLTDDAWVVTFCDSAGLDYARPMAARAALPGGATQHWT